MSITPAINFKLSVPEILGTNSELATAAQGTHNIEMRESLNGTTTPPATKAFSDEINLATGAATIDLADLEDIAGNALDFTGLKLQYLVFKAPNTNTSPVEVDVGATNGYNFAGDSASHVVIPAGGMVVLVARDNLPDVGAAAKDIDLSSADADAKLQVVLVAG